MRAQVSPDTSSTVALRKESVDRNLYYGDDLTYSDGSLSARRAWIEIPAGCWRDSRRAVALRKESVDRNYYADKEADWVRGRSPQGERG